MGRNKSNPPPYTGIMEDGLNTLQRLQQWSAAAGLLYAPNSPVNSPPSANEPHALSVARRIAIVMGRLNELCRREAEVLLTPRLALLELADIIRQGLVSFHGADAGGQRSNAEALATYVAHRTAPQSGIIEGLHTITWVSVKLRVELFAEQLRRHLQGELEMANNDGNRAEEQLSALRTTQTLFSDFESLYDDLLVTFPCVHLMNTAPEVGEQLMPVLTKQFYQLAEWVGLVEVSNSLPPITETQVQSIDTESFSFVMHRKNLSSPWGLVFNECGRIVGIDPSLRGASPAGEELHRLLRSSAKGAAIVAVNTKTVQRAPPSDPGKVLGAIQEAMKTSKRVSVKVAKDIFRHPHVQQLAFFMPNQGGEGSSGQRATLVLHRYDRRTSWGYELDESLIIKKISKRELSEGARNFFSEYGGRISLMSVNGVEVTTVVQADALCADTETVVLSFVVITPALVRQRASRLSKQTTSVTLSHQQIEEAQETPLITEAKATPAPRKSSKKANEDSPGEETLDKGAAGPVAESEADLVENAARSTLTDEKDVDANEDGNARSEPERGEEPDAEEHEETYVRGEQAQDALARAEAALDGEGSGPLVFPNSVAIDLLTPSEMVIRRPSTDNRWGLVLNKIGTASGDALRVLELPELPSQQTTSRRHPFYKIFKHPPVPTEWRIESVNNIPVTKAADILEIMRKSLKLSIKFFRM
uniref:Uncharacterized protein n=1 Tax=Trypanosoma congolense (strain IL3000) TaxID=1068625 RepID=G0UXZ4_TRYCI|nr:conserved hypothetical protein [Trypanosoma congolense IL3000]